MDLDPCPLSSNIVDQTGGYQSRVGDAHGGELEVEKDEGLVRLSEWAKVICVWIALLLEELKSLLKSTCFVESKVTHLELPRSRSPAPVAISPRE